MVAKENNRNKRSYISNENEQSASSINNPSSLKDVRESHIILQDIVENTDYLQKRQGELEEIKIISSQIKEISKYMGVQVAKSGEDLNRLEDLVIDSKVNTQNAEEQINIAEKDTRSSTRKICCLIGIILFFVISIVAIVIIVFKKD